MLVKGTFEVKVASVAENKAEGLTLGRFSLAKQYHGELEATGEGEMLTGSTSVQGSAAYVAVERVTGMLSGCSGSFLLQHAGTMNRGTPSLAITVVPDSGTGDLAGLTGGMNIVIADGKHFYELEYSLTPTS
jgi:Protein of unknown function (DUF3224)